MSDMIEASEVKHELQVMAHTKCIRWARPEERRRWSTKRLEIYARPIPVARLTWR